MSELFLFVKTFIKVVFHCCMTILFVILAYFEPIKAPVNIFIMLFIIDFATGLKVSFKRGEHFKSSKARWSFAKLICYTGSFATLLFIGKNLQIFEAGGNDLLHFLWIIKLVVYAGMWFECKSIVENLCILFPKNQFLKFLDYLIGIEFLQKIPPLANFIKEEKDKQNPKKGSENH